MRKQNCAGTTSFSSLLAVILSIIAALFILVIFILPAEFGKDITGLGEKFGVNKMSVTEVEAEIESSETPLDIKSLLNNTLDHDDDPNRIEGDGHISFAKPLQFMETEIVLEADGHGEYKFDLLKGNLINYTLTVADGKKVYIDVHGHNPGTDSESEGDDLLARYLDTQEDNTISGQFIAPFDGDHGWYLLNLQPEEIRIKITASGHWDGHEFLPLESYY